MTQVVDAARQGFVGEPSPGPTPGRRSLALAGLLGAARRLRPARDAPHRAIERRRRSPALSELAARCRAVLEASHAEGERARRAATPTRGRARAAIRGSGTGTRASRRSSGGASTRAARAPSSRPCSPRSAPDGFIGHTIFWDQPVSLAGGSSSTTSPRAHAAMTGTIQPPLLAWAWRIAVGDPAAEPRIAAHHEWLRGQPRPRGRRAAVDRAARRVGARRLAEVRPGLGPARARAARLPAAGRAATGGSAGTRGGSATRGGPVLCEVMTNVLWCSGAARGRRAVDHPGAGRPALGRAARPLPRRGAARRRAARRSRPGRRSPRSRCPTCRRRSAAAWSRSTCSTRERYWLTGPAALGLRRGAELRARPRPRAGSAATGAGRPGSTPPGCSGSGCAGSATTSRGRARWPSGSAGRVAARGPARVLRPAHGRGARGARLRLVDPDRRAGRAVGDRPSAGLPRQHD